MNESEIRRLASRMLAELEWAVTRSANDDVKTAYSRFISLLQITHNKDAKKLVEDALDIISKELYKRNIEDRN